MKQENEDLWRCTVCGRIGPVGRCCGHDTRERVTQSVEKTTCPMCGKPGRHNHNCPYSSEIDGDDETMCNCCDECTDDCRDEV